MNDDKSSNRGVLYINQNKDEDWHPDRQGKAFIDGMDYWVDGWVAHMVKGVNQEPYLQLRFRPMTREYAMKEQQKRSQGGRRSRGGGGGYGEHRGGGRSRARSDEQRPLHYDEHQSRRRNYDDDERPPRRDYDEAPPRQEARAPAPPPGGASGFDDMDSDIPF